MYSYTCCSDSIPPLPLSNPSPSLQPLSLSPPPLPPSLPSPSSPPLPPSPSPQMEELRILEALAASGLRSIRYALEVPAVAHVVANDYSTEAYENMCRNIRHNSVEGKVLPSCKDARYIHVQCISMCLYVHIIENLCIYMFHYCNLHQCCIYTVLCMNIHVVYMYSHDLLGGFISLDFQALSLQAYKL